MKPLLVAVTRIGFKPMTYCLEGSCSIQLSYRAKIGGKDKGTHFMKFRMSYKIVTINNLTHTEVRLTSFPK